MTGNRRGRASTRIRDAIDPRPGEIPGALAWRTAVVTVVTTSTVPYLVTVRFADGTTAQCTYPGWWNAQVGAVVNLLQRLGDGSLLCIGPDSPARLVVGGHTHTVDPIDPAAPAAPDPPPAAPPAITTARVTPNSASSWVPAYSNWRTDGVYQGGGSAQRGFWYYGTKVATAKGAGTIIAATVYVMRQNSSHGVAGSQKANVRLGVHGQTSQPATGGTSHTSVAVVGGLARGKAAVFRLSAAQVAALNGGSKGLGLEPGSSGYTSVDYLIATVGGASGQLTLTVQT